MQIDMLITELNPGGAEKCFANIAEYLSKCGHSVRAISIGPAPINSQKNLVEQLKAANVELHFLNARRVLDFHGTAKRIRNLLNDKKPDICQSFLFHANFFAAWVYYPNQIPIVTGNRVAEPNWVRQGIGIWINQRATKVACVSNSVAAWTERNERTNREKITVIQNGISLRSAGQLSKDSSRIRAELGIESSAVVSIFVGRLDTQKGVDLLSQTFDRLLNAANNHHLILMGDGPLRDKIDDAVTKSELSSRIHVVGWQPNPRDWMRVSDLLLLPARYEGMPNVVLEAMAESLPVACTKAEGISELLGENTDLQTAKDFDAWCELVTQLVNDKTKRAALGESNFNRCAENFDLIEKMELYDQLYRRVLEA